MVNTPTSMQAGLCSILRMKSEQIGASRFRLLCLSNFVRLCRNTWNHCGGDFTPDRSSKLGKQSYLITILQAVWNSVSKKKSRVFFLHPVMTDKSVENKTTWRERNPSSGSAFFPFGLSAPLLLLQVVRQRCADGLRHDNGDQCARGARVRQSGLGLPELHSSDPHWNERWGKTVVGLEECGGVAGTCSPL